MSDFVAVVGNDAKSRELLRLADLGYLSMSILPSARLMKQPRENGTLTTDHRIVDPLSINVSLVLPPDNYQQTWGIFYELFLTGASLVVKMKTGVYDNMVISTMPLQENATDATLFIVDITLEQAMFNSAQFQALPPAAVGNAADASTVDRGQQSTGRKADGNKRSGSTAYRIFY